ncbi:Hypothetical predicted protein [Mytilus galloprovincialis]|uniref:Axin interactor dorsalization-associated protein N-terminal domain-containing protein n=1 Tax=Mytilus galloprovincialis TaxID=29158 RepID=A0A8B6HAK2_MYTGA|nr:Hypothetical predicted protein [Mytilus galloprovincialis]
MAKGVIPRLSKQLQQCSNVDCQIFTDEQKKILSKISICLDLRCKALQNPGSIEGILLDDLKKIGNSKCFIFLFHMFVLFKT